MAERGEAAHMTKYPTEYKVRPYRKADIAGTRRHSRYIVKSSFPHGDGALGHDNLTKSFRDARNINEIAWFQMAKYLVRADVSC